MHLLASGADPVLIPKWIGAIAAVLAAAVAGRRNPRGAGQRGPDPALRRDGRRTEHRWRQILRPHHREYWPHHRARRPDPFCRLRLRRSVPGRCPRCSALEFSPNHSTCRPAQVACSSGTCPATRTLSLLAPRELRQPRPSSRPINGSPQTAGKPGPTKRPTLGNSPTGRQAFPVRSPERKHREEATIRTSTCGTSLTVFGLSRITLVSSTDSRSRAGAYRSARFSARRSDASRQAPSRLHIVRNRVLVPGLQLNETPVTCVEEVQHRALRLMNPRQLRQTVLAQWQPVHLPV